MQATVVPFRAGVMPQWRRSQRATSTTHQAAEQLTAKLQRLLDMQPAAAMSIGQIIDVLLRTGGQR
jgi:hypothetical protein